MKSAPTTRWSWWIAASPIRCAACRRRTSRSRREIKTCRQFLKSELETLPNVKVILALGKIAHDSVLRHAGRAQGARIPSSMAWLTRSANSR